MSKEFETQVLNLLSDIFKGQEEIRDELKEMNERLTELEITSDSSGFGYND